MTTFIILFLASYFINASLPKHDSLVFTSFCFSPSLFSFSFFRKTKLAALVEFKKNKQKQKWNDRRFFLFSF